jgi:hypothetical protein
MSEYSALDNIKHGSLKVKKEFGTAYGDSVNQSRVFPTEFRMLQREYPIFFRRSNDGQFYTVVLLGLDKDENLFLNSGEWSARYIPAMHSKGPFALGRKTANNNEPLVTVDMSDARVGQDEGENVFLPYGGNSSYFEEMLQSLKQMYEGARVEREFYTCLQSLDLIDPVTVQAKLTDDFQYTIPDLYTISQSKMAALSGDGLAQLNRPGMLEHCFFVMSSVGNVSRLVEMKTMASSQKSEAFA